MTLAKKYRSPLLLVVAAFLCSPSIVLAKLDNGIYHKSLPPNACVIGTSITVQIAASSGLPVTVNNSNPDAISVTRYWNATSITYFPNVDLTFKSLGEVTLTMTQAGDDYYDPATPVSQTFSCKYPQTISSFTEIPHVKTLGDADFSLNAGTASSGLPVTLVSSDTNTASIVNGKVHIKRIGATVISAVQIGDDTYHPTSIPQTLWIMSPISHHVVQWNSSTPSPTDIPVELDSIVGVASGVWNAFALKSNGKVVVWNFGSFFDHGQNNVSDLDSVVAIAAGLSHTILLKSNGTVVGRGSNTSAWESTPPAGLDSVVAIAANGDKQNPSSAALKSNGTVVVWGVIDPYSTGSFMPTGLDSVVAVAVGAFYVVALRSNGTVVTWGDVELGYHYCGDVTPILQVPQGLDSVVAIAADGATILALRSNGTVVSWGYNLGVEPVPADLDSVIAIHAYKGNFQAIRSNGTVVVWGPDFMYDVKVPPGLSGVTGITGSVSDFLALGGVTQNIIFDPLPLKTLGDRDFYLHATGGGSGKPVTFASSDTSIASVVHDKVHIKKEGVVTITASQEGSLSYWTAVPVSQTLTIQLAQVIAFDPLPVKTLGDADFALNATCGTAGAPVSFTSSDTNTATVVNGMVHIKRIGFTVITATSAGDAGVAITPVPQWRTLRIWPPARPVVAWGDNTYGQTKIPDGLDSVVAVSVGVYHTVALKPNGTVVAWGDNTYGQTTVPADLDSVVAVVAGNSSIFALRSNGSMVAWGDVVIWGDSSYGITSIHDLDDLVDIASYSNHAVALKWNGTVIAWGGVDTIALTVPPGLDSVVGIATGGSGSLALRSNGTVVPWGRGKIFTDLPAGLDSVVAIDAKGVDALALRSNGTVVTWGNGNPTIPADLDSVVAVAASNSSKYRAALRSNGSLVALDATVLPDNLAGKVFVAIAARGSSHMAALGGIPQAITFGPIPVKTYGDADFALNATGGASGNAVAFASSDTNIVAVANGTVHIKGAGVTGITATQAGNGDYIYATPVLQTLTINKATPVLTWESPAGITYGTLLSELQLNASASAAGIFNYTPTAGTKLNAGADHALSVHFVPTDVSNYESVSKSVFIQVGQKSVSVTAIADTIIVGATEPTLAYDADDLLDGDSFTGKLSRKSGTTAGTYPISIGTLSAGGNYTIDFTGADFVIQSGPVYIEPIVPQLAFTGRANARIFNLQGKLVWSGMLDVNNGRVTMPNMGAGQWVVKFEMGKYEQVINTFVR